MSKTPRTDAYVIQEKLQTHTNGVHSQVVVNRLITFSRTLERDNEALVDKGLQLKARIEKLEAVVGIAYQEVGELLPLGSRDVKDEKVLDMLACGIPNDDILPYVKKKDLL